jgi:L-fuconolactonase
MIAADLRFDALVLPRHLPNLRRFAARYPDLRIVIDHAAKPDIAGQDLGAWARDIRAIAAETPLACKLSGLVTEAAPGWGADDLRPVTDILIDAFGPTRLMWGSDWPVLNLNGDYLSWRAAADALTADLAETDREWVFGRAAGHFYGIA